MKKKILTTVILGALTLSSCSNNGTKTEAKDAKEVIVNSTEDITIFNKINEKSEVDWRGSHLGGTQPRYGKIDLKNASFSIENKKLVNASVVMDMNSLTVENYPEGDEQIAILEEHLKADDFFDVTQYPTAKFELTDTESITGDFASLVTGNLTILEVTKSISFQANISISETSVSIKSEDFSVNRADWNLIYNAEGTSGVPVDYLISNDIGFTIDVTIEN